MWILAQSGQLVNLDWIYSFQVNHSGSGQAWCVRAYKARWDKVDYVELCQCRAETDAFAVLRRIAEFIKAGDSPVLDLS